MTFLETMKRNKRKIPIEFLLQKFREAETPIFGIFSLVSHVTKNKKTVILLPTVHNDGEINPDTNKPTMIHDYNCIEDALILWIGCSLLIQRHVLQDSCRWQYFLENCY